MKTKYILLLTFVSALFAGCGKERIETYDMGECKVYFQSQTSSGANGSAGYGTSSTFSFVDKSTEVWPNVVLPATINIMGDVKDYDRPVKVIVDEERSTMKEGEGFEIDLDSVVVRAGKNFAKFQVRFYRTKQLQTQTDTLRLKLLPNEEFNVLEKYKASNSWGDTNAAMLDGSTWTFTVSEIYTEPGRWGGQNANAYFGPWNPTKYVYINELFGFVSDDWIWETGKISKERMGFYARELQKELQRRADIGDPVYDEDGSYMQLPDAYHVDYSNIGNKKD